MLFLLCRPSTSRSYAKLSTEHPSEFMKTLPSMFCLSTHLRWIVCDYSPQKQLCVASVAFLLDVEKENVIGALRDLRSVLYLPIDPSSTIRPLHPSFREFLSDLRRCIDQSFVVDNTLSHYDVSRHCFRVMSNRLKQFMCGPQYSGVGPTQLGEQSLRRYLPLHLQYSYHYWVAHLLRSDRMNEEEARVVDLRQKKSLYWLSGQSS
jgi:hypothetical protein